MSFSKKSPKTMEKLISYVEKYINTKETLQITKDIEMSKPSRKRRYEEDSQAKEIEVLGMTLNINHP